MEAGKVKELWKKGVDSQRRLLLNHAVNVSFLLGDQWLQPEGKDSLRLVQSPRDPDRVRLTVNRILPATRILMAKMHKKPLVWEVPPPAADDASVMMAKVAESVLASAARDQNWEQKRVETDWNTWLGGTGILSVDWDPRLGQPTGQVSSKGRKVGTGDVRVTSSSISQAVLEPGSREAETGRWWIRGVALPPEHVKEMFGLQSTPQADSTAGAADGQIADVSRRQSSPGPDLTLVYHYYERPSDNGDGQVVTIVGNEIVEEGAWPFPWRDRLNLAVQRETVLPGQWCGDTVLTSAVMMQSAYNMSWSSLIEHLKLVGNARGLMPEGNLDLLDEMTDAPGEWTVYRPDAGAPTYLSPPQMPQWCLDSPAMLRREMDDLMGVQDISRGAAPSNIESGLGVSILAEAADTPVMQMAAESARAWGQIGSMSLKLYGEYAKETRKARIRVEGHGIEQVSWTGDKLSDVTDAEVPLEQVMPKSRAAQEAYATRLWELGIVQDPEVIAEIADLPDKESFIAAMNPDAGKQARENFEMTLGKDCEPAPFDDHAVHLRVLNRFRKSERYEQLDDAGKARVDGHADAHEELARAEQVEVAAEQALSPVGAPPPLADEAMGAPMDPAIVDPTAGMGVPDMTDLTMLEGDV